MALDQLKGKDSQVSLLQALLLEGPLSSSQSGAGLSPSSVSSLEDLGQVIELSTVVQYPMGSVVKEEEGQGPSMVRARVAGGAENALVLGWPRSLTEGLVHCQRSHMSCAAWFRGQATHCLFMWSQAPNQASCP